jgi:hypothetical protein
MIIRKLFTLLIVFGAVTSPAFAQEKPVVGLIPNPSPTK